MELTTEEVELALDNARRDKYYAEEQKNEYARYQKRRNIFLGPWNAEMMLDFIVTRAKTDTKMRFHTKEGDGRPVFVIDDKNCHVIHALCMYFTNDERFERLELRLPDGGTKPLNYKLNKGILLGGPKGTGKSSIMRLFTRNKRNCYHLYQTGDLTKLFANTKKDEGGYEALTPYEYIVRFPKSEDNFYNEEHGICFEDIGTEEEPKHYGNSVNVFAHLFQARYNNNVPFYMTHGTTNLGYDQWGKMYGERVQDRAKEIFNWILLDGESRR